MSNDPSAPAPTPPPHVVGESYEYQQIRTDLGGQAIPPNFVIQRAGVIVGVCLGLMWNPRAEADPCEVWVGRKPELTPWGVKLADTKRPLPVYVRREQGGKWTFTGLHEVTGSTVDLPSIKERLQPPVITGISRIVFLKRLA